jgi:hypothetical protein
MRMWSATTEAVAFALLESSVIGSVRYVQELGATLTPPTAHHSRSDRRIILLCRRRRLGSIQNPIQSNANML